MRYYLAGPMTGYELYNFPAFDAEAARLRALGHTVVSPADLDRSVGFDPAGPVLPGFLEEAMRRDLTAILSCDALVLMPGWRDSKGTALEVEVARAVGMPMLAAETLEPIADELPGASCGPVQIGSYSDSRATSFTTADSGTRQEFPTGSRRDSRDGKGRYDLIAPRGLRRLAQLYERGAVKYGDRNWERGQPVSRYLDSAIRHLFAYLQGERAEDHLAAAAWNALGAAETEERAKSGALPVELLDVPGQGI